MTLYIASITKYTENLCYASEQVRSVLENLWHFCILKVLFLSIFVSVLPVQMICLSAKCTDKFPDVPTKLHYWGGGGQLPPPPPLLR